jgi:hypothetical protein
LGKSEREPDFMGIHLGISKIKRNLMSFVFS